MPRNTLADQNKEQFSEIIEQLENLPILLDNPKDALKIRLKNAYLRSLHLDLTEIFEKTPDAALFEQLENFLKNNWELVNGTLLSYTALTYEPTMLLCNIAERISEHKNTLLKPGAPPITSVEILMPGLNFESIHNDYMDLCATKRLPPLTDEQQNEFMRLSRLKLKNLLTENDINTLIELEKPEKQAQGIKKGRLKIIKDDYVCMDLQTLLHTHIISHDRKSLIPVIVLLDDLEKHFVTRPYDPSQEITNNELSSVMVDAKADELHRLETHSNIAEAIVDANTRLKKLESGKKANLFDHLSDLLQKLKENDAYSGLGTETNAGQGTYEPIRIFAEYYDSLGYQIRTFNEKIEAEFLMIDIQLTEAQPGQYRIHYRFKRKDGVIKEGDLTDAQVTQLRDRMQQHIESKFKTINSTRQLNGLSPIPIPEPSSDPAKRLFELFEELKELKEELISCLAQWKIMEREEEPKNQIPPRLKAEIELLINLSSDPTKNKNATENMETCIARRRNNLEGLVRTNEVTLTGIACTDQYLTSKKNEAKMTLKTLIDSFKSKIENHEGLAGQDKLPIRRELLDHFWKDSNGQFKIQSKQDLKDWLELDERDLNALIANEEDKKTIVSQFKNLEDFIWFIHEISATRLKTLFNLAHPYLLAPFCKTESDIRALLSSLEKEKLDIVLKNMLKQTKISSTLLRAFIYDHDKFIQILKQFSTEIDRINAIKAKNKDGETVLHKAVNSPEPFKTLLEILSADKSELFNTIKEKNTAGNTIFHIAAKNRFNTTNSLKLLLGNCLDLFQVDELINLIKEKNNEEETILHLAYSNPESLESILNIFPTSNDRLNALLEKDFDQCSAIHYAANYENSESLKTILTQLSPNDRLKAIKEKTGRGNSALRIAMEEGSNETFNILLELLPADELLSSFREKKIHSHHSLLFDTVSKPSKLKKFLELLPNNEERLNALKEKNDAGRTLIYHAAISHPKALKAIFELFPDNAQRIHILKNQSIDGKIELHSVASQPESIQTILEILPKQDIIGTLKGRDKQGNTVILWAAQAKNFSSLELLLKMLPEEERVNALKETARNGQTVLQYVLADYFSISSVLSIVPQKNIAQDPILAGILLQHYTDDDQLTRLIQQIPNEMRLKAYKKDHSGRTLLHHVASDPELLNDILRLYPDNTQRIRALKEPDNDGKTALHKAASHPESLKIILALYPSAEQGLRAIMEENIAQDPEIIASILRILLENQTTLKPFIEQIPRELCLNALKVKDEHGLTVFHAAVSPVETLKFIFSLYPDEPQLNIIKKANDDGDSLLHIAAPHPKLLEYILGLYPNDEERRNAVQEKNIRGKTVLLQAVSNPESLEVILKLYTNDQERLKAIRKVNKILRLAATTPKSLEIILNLYPNKEERLKAIQANDRRGNTALYYSASNHQSLKTILDLYSNQPERLRAIQEKNQNDETVLHNAASDPESLREILALYPMDHRLNAVKEKGGDGKTVLELATEHHESIRAILSMLAITERFDAIREKDRDGISILDKATTHPNLMHAILESFDHQNQLSILQEKDSKGMTLLHKVISYPKVMEIIFAKIPKKVIFDFLTRQDNDGDTVFHKAMVSNSPESLNAIFKTLSTDELQKALSEENHMGRTILHKAVFQPKLLKVVLEQFTDNQQCLNAIKKRAIDGNTPLQLAFSSPESLKILMEKLPPEKRLLALKEKNSNYRILLDDVVFYPNSLSSILEVLPEKDRIDVLYETISNGNTVLDSVYDKKESLTAIFEFIPPHQRLQFVIQGKILGKICLTDFDANNLIEFLPLDKSIDSKFKIELLKQLSSYLNLTSSPLDHSFFASRPTNTRGKNEIEAIINFFNNAPLSQSDINILKNGSIGEIFRQYQMTDKLPNLKETPSP